MSESTRRPHEALWEATYAPGAVALIVAASLARLILLSATPLNLYPDEAQYWFWAQTPDLGYFSKPPLIAWIIAGTTFVCGDGEACVRAAAPVLHGLTAALLFLLGRDLYGARVGLWAAGLYLTLPAVFVSAMIISTDVPLLTAFAAALVALHRSLTREGLLWPLLAGLAVGIAMLAKYAVLFAVPGILILALVRSDMRTFLFSGRGFAAAAAALIVVAPNLLWNVESGFATVVHTASNANWSAERYNFDELGDFAVSQLGVFGPLTFVFFVLGSGVALARAASPGPAARADVLLLAFALPILLILFGQAFLSRANANWAALAYVPATVLVAAWGLRWGMRWLLALSIVIHLSVGIAAAVVIVKPAALASIDSLFPRQPIANGLKRLKGWDVIGEEIRQRVASGDYTAVLSSDREDIAEFVYYARGLAIPIVKWNGNGLAQDHFELTLPYRPQAGDKVLLVTRVADPAMITSRFAQVSELAPLSIDVGGGRTRDFRFFSLAQPNFVPAERVD